MGHKKGSRWKSLFLGSLALLASNLAGIAHSSPEILLDFKNTGPNNQDSANELLERVKIRAISLSSEPADAVLIRRKEWQWHPYLKSLLNLPNWFHLVLEHRTRFEVYDHPWRSSQPSGRTDPQIQQRSRLRFGLNGEIFKLLFEGQDSRVHLDGPSDFVSTSTKNEWDILQIVISGTARNIFATGLRTDFHFGRLTLDFGGRRLIARNAFRNTTNTFDGLHWQLARENQWRLRAFLVEPVLRDSNQLDEQSKRSVFWGAYIESKHLGWLEFNAYYFGLNDQRSPSLSSQRTFSTFGIRLHKNPETNQLDYELETVWQTGKRGSIDHFAHFQHLNVGYSFNIPWSPRLLIHYDYASGDRNPNDSQDSAFDTLFGARRFEYMPTGNFGPFFRTNLNSPGWRIIFTPTIGWKFQVKHRIWYLATSRGSFSSNGLRDGSGNSGSFLGQDIELQAQWTINTNLTFEAGYDHWFKGNYFDRLPNSAGLPPDGEKDTDYFYILTKFRI